MIDLETMRYEDLTTAEMVSMIEGPRLTIAGETNAAERVMQLSLDLEHQISTLPLDTSGVRASFVAEIRQRRDQLRSLTNHAVLLHLFGERPGDPPLAGNGTAVPPVAATTSPVKANAKQPRSSE